MSSRVASALQAPATRFASRVPLDGDWRRLAPPPCPLGSGICRQRVGQLVDPQLAETAGQVETLPGLAAPHAVDVVAALDHIDERPAVATRLGGDGVEGSVERGRGRESLGAELRAD